MKKYAGVTNQLARQSLEQAATLNGVTKDVIQKYALGCIALASTGFNADTPAQSYKDHLSEAIEQVLNYMDRVYTS